MIERPSRRAFFGRVLAGAGTLVLAGCDRLSMTDWFPKVLATADRWSSAAAHVIGRKAMAQEFTAADLSPRFRSNGTAQPDNPEYLALAQGEFADYRLVVDGLVAQPLRLSLAEVKALPSRTQIT